MERFKPLLWLPDSLATKTKFGFRADSRVEDGSECSTQIIEELTLCGGKLKDKVYTLYACGVVGYEGKIFSPKQLISMIAHQNPFEVDQVCRWIGGIRTESGIIYGPNPKRKQALFELLCDTLDRWNPKKFRDIPKEAIENIKEQLKFKPKTVSDYELTVYLVASYSQFAFLFIHPFWNRNARTSEEMMHLFCLSNSAGKRVFWQDAYTRSTEAALTRMKLINHLALELLSGALGNLGVSTTPNSALTHGYKQHFLNENRFLSRIALASLSPYHFRFVAEYLAPKQTSKYFQEIEERIGDMISKVRPSSFGELVKEKPALELLRHHLIYGLPSPSIGT